ncbi:hypothetical protein L6452_31607 [Arctium lappa]|uniref:Uncharacterized protein n=1 Tax=Arctium lappa TaxID=4217 RepID=A0ACB8Z250_ARCLA|nr:hypothetical protein L6452_31607 [Arctium lappa]
MGLEVVETKASVAMACSTNERQRQLHLLLTTRGSLRCCSSTSADAPTDDHAFDKHLNLFDSPAVSENTTGFSVSVLSSISGSPVESSGYRSQISS